MHTKTPCLARSRPEPIVHQCNKTQPHIGYHRCPCGVVWDASREAVSDAEEGAEA